MTEKTEDLVSEAYKRVYEGGNIFNEATPDENLIKRLADRIAALTTPQEGEAREVTLERAFARWRDQEIDQTGALPEGYEMFKAGWKRAVAAMEGEHDHIEDGANYLDCAACAFSADGQPILEALLEVVMGLPVSVRRDTTELGRAILAAFPSLSRAAAPEPRVITTPEEELDLQPGTVVRFADGHAAELSLYGSHPRQWYCFGRYYLTAFPEELLPATVLYEPTMDGGEGQ